MPAAYLARRLAQLVIVLLLVSVAVFSIMHALPGDPVQLMLSGAESGSVTPERQEQLREEMGLNDPLHVQYGRFLGGAATARPRNLGPAAPARARPDPRPPGLDACAQPRRHPLRGAHRRHHRRARRAQGRLVDRRIQSDSGLRGRVAAPVLARAPAHPGVLLLAAVVSARRFRGASLAGPPQPVAGARVGGGRRASHPRLAARSARGGLHPHGLGQGPPQSTSSTCATPSGTP